MEQITGAQEAEEAASPRRRAGVKRQRRAPGGRNNTVWVRLSDAELAVARARAARLRVTVPRLAAEAMLSGSVQSMTERRALFEEVMVVRRLLAALGSNVNQIARLANATGQSPVLDAPVEMIARVLARTDATLSALRVPSA